MKTPLLSTLVILCLFTASVYAQSLSQYFDGADTIPGQSLFIELDTSSTNVWQIGPPHKNIFNAASTVPNALVTDTINYYPINNSSSFYFDADIDAFGWGILAFQWTQKLDLDEGMDGGLIEYTIDGGNSWQSVFNSPYVYSFYGFDQANVSSIPNHGFAFTGRDSIWKDIWLCFDVSWLNQNDSMQFKYTLKSDSLENNREGWLIDNFLIHTTIIHTATSEKEQENYLEIYPNPTSGRLEINAQKINGYHLIEELNLYNVSGRLIKSYGKCPTKFSIDLSDQSPGVYYLKIKTNLQTETFRIVVQN